MDPGFPFIPHQKEFDPNNQVVELNNKQQRENGKHQTANGKHSTSKTTIANCNFSDQSEKKNLAFLLIQPKQASILPIGSSYPTTKFKDPIKKKTGQIKDGITNKYSKGSTNPR